MCSFNRNPGDSSFMLRLGRHYPGKKTWGPAHMNCLMLQKLEHREQRIALEELLGAVRQESERVERLEQAILDPAVKARPYDMQLSLAHGALETEQQSVVERAWAAVGNASRRIS
jgi:hypothetical protein